MTNITFSAINIHISPSEIIGTVVWAGQKDIGRALLYILLRAILSFPINYYKSKLTSFNTMNKDYSISSEESRDIGQVLSSNIGRGGIISHHVHSKALGCSSGLCDPVVSEAD